jgi:hypothetical protein
MIFNIAYNILLKNSEGLSGQSTHRLCYAGAFLEYYLSIGLGSIFKGTFMPTCKHSFLRIEQAFASHYSGGRYAAGYGHTAHPLQVYCL